MNFYGFIDAHPLDILKAILIKEIENTESLFNSYGCLGNLNLDKIPEKQAVAKYRDNNLIFRQNIIHFLLLDCTNAIRIKRCFLDSGERHAEYVSNDIQHEKLKFYPNYLYYGINRDFEQYAIPSIKFYEELVVYYQPVFVEIVTLCDMLFVERIEH
jgi:hypothetical protein